MRGRGGLDQGGISCGSLRRGLSESLHPIRRAMRGRLTVTGRRRGSSGTIRQLELGLLRRLKAHNLKLKGEINYEAHNLKGEIN